MGHNASLYAKSLREKFMEYFVNDGAVECSKFLFQTDLILFKDYRKYKKSFAKYIHVRLSLNVVGAYLLLLRYTKIKGTERISLLAVELSICWHIC